MANQLVTDLDAIITLPDSGIIHVIDTTVTTQNAAGSSFKITKANLLKENTAAILLNTAKVGITPSQTSAITANTSKIGYTEALVNANTNVVANTAKVGITTGQASSITTNNSKVGYTDALVALAPTVVANTAKVGITTTQATEITNNTGKVGYTDALVAAAPTVVANTAKIGITPTQATAITTNSSKVGYTDALVAAAPTVVANSAKVGITTTQASAITTNASGLAAALISINNNINNACAKYVADFRNRVLIDGGILEDLNNVTTNLRVLYASTFFNKISFLFLPAGAKAGKAYTLLPENGNGDFTAVRNTTATRVNINGIEELVALNVPRLNYDTVGGNPNLLLEPQRTNLLLNSATLSTQSIATTASTHTLSFKGTGTVTLSGSFSGSLVGTGANNRVTLTFTPTSGTLTVSVSGSCTNGQIELGANATSYIPTTSAAVTRNADLISKTGISDVIGQTEGVFFLEIKALIDANTYHLIRIGNATLKDRLVIGYNNTPGKIYLEYKTNDVIRISNSAFDIVKTNNNKIAVRYKSGEQTLFLNGIKTIIGTSTDTFTNLVDELSFSYGNITNLTFEGKVNGLQLYKTALTDAECISLTTL